MPTLHKFKLLATQCAVAGSPTRSPTTSPVIHLRRRKTLRMFLARPDRRRFPPPDLPPPQDPPQIAADEVRVRHKLKDLFVSSPSPPQDHHQQQQQQQQRQQQQQEQERLLHGSTIGVRFRTGPVFRRGGAAALRPVSSAFRYRLVRRAWRPMLVTIPE